MRFRIKGKKISVLSGSFHLSNDQQNDCLGTMKAMELFNPSMEVIECI